MLGEDAKVVEYFITLIGILSCLAIAVGLIIAEDARARKPRR